MKTSNPKREYDATISYNKGYDLQESGDINGAIEAYKLAANLGATDAMSRLGTIFDDMMQPNNVDLALYWYKRGVKAGSAGCAWNLAMHYAGTGNKRWYRYWLGVAKIIGSADAEEELKSGHWWNKRNLSI